MKKKILELLQNCPDFISGQELSERFGVSRTAVWKVIRQLEAEGYVIQAVRNKGYRLTAQPDLLTEEKFKIRYIRNGRDSSLSYFPRQIQPTIRQKSWLKKVPARDFWWSVTLRQQGKDAVAAPGNPEWAKEFL